MTSHILSFLGHLSGSLLKWGLIAVLWLASVVFVTTNALALDAISDAMWKVAGIPSMHLNQKKTVKKQQAIISKQKKSMQQQRGAINKAQTDLRKQKTAVRRHSTRVNRFVSKMAVRNISDATTSVIPIAGGLMSVTFAVADVHAACEMFNMQNELDAAFGVDHELSTMQSGCVTYIEEIEGIERSAEESLAEIEETGQQVALAVETAGEALSETVNEWKEQVPTAEEMQRSAEKQWCRVTGNC